MRSNGVGEVVFIRDEILPQGEAAPTSPSPRKRGSPPSPPTLRAGGEGLEDVTFREAAAKALDIGSSFKMC